MPILAELKPGVMMDAEQLIKFTAGPARIIFNDAGAIYRAVFHFIRPNASHGVFTIPAVLNHNRDQWMRYAKGILHVEEAVAYAMIHEAWLLQADIPRIDLQKVLDEYAVKGLEDHPDRKEVVSLTAEDQNGAANGYMEITRTALNPRPVLGPLVMIPPTEGETVEGRFVGMLPRTTKAN